jgi:exonuclease VII large subunit
VLKELGLNHKNTWIIYDKAPKQFFEFLTTNFDEKNILSDEELGKFKELKESNEWLNKQKVNESMKWVKEKYPEIDNLSDDLIRELENDLDFYTNLLNDRDRRCEEIQRKIFLMHEEINSNKQEEDDLNHLEKRLSESCSSSIKKLDQIIKENHEKIKTINNLYSQVSLK